MSYFDAPVARERWWCSVCKRETDHDRAIDGAALWTCRDPKHPHPTREQQEAGLFSVRGAAGSQVIRR